MAGLILLPLLTIAGWLIGLALGAEWLLPFLNAAPACWFMVTTLRRGERERAIALMLWWGLWLGIAGVGASIRGPRGPGWSSTTATRTATRCSPGSRAGVGRESSPGAFIPQHLLHAAIFVALSLLTAGTLSILMGCVLMNYMSFYVGSLILHCSGGTRRHDRHPPRMESLVDGAGGLVHHPRGRPLRAAPVPHAGTLALSRWPRLLDSWPATAGRLLHRDEGPARAAVAPTSVRLLRAIGTLESTRAFKALWARTAALRPCP